jgi:hypothetical protein
MPSPTITALNYTYKKPDTDVWVLNTTDIPVPFEKIKDQQIVHLAPQSTGGNHRHPRTEWWVAIGELELIWQDENGEVHTEHMNPEGKILLIEMPPLVPHAVRNISNTQRGILMEWADEKMKDAEVVKLTP